MAKEKETIEISKEDDTKVLCVTSSGHTVLESTVYIFPKNIFSSLPPKERVY